MEHIINKEVKFPQGNKVKVYDTKQKKYVKGVNPEHTYTILSKLGKSKRNYILQDEKGDKIFSNYVDFKDFII